MKRRSVKNAAASIAGGEKKKKKLKLKLKGQGHYMPPVLDQRFRWVRPQRTVV
jgi:hypothetical protein